MQAVSCDNLLNAIGGRPVDWMPGRQPVNGISLDSRTIHPGALFWAIRGEKQDGHTFVADALGRGALAAVVEDDQAAEIAGPKIVVPNTQQALGDAARWYRRRQEVRLVGVTGSFGKTTTREMIYAALKGRLSGMRSPENFNNQFGVPLSLFGIESGHDFAVLELAASAQGEIRHLAEMAAPSIGVITGIGQAHIGRFGSQRCIRQTKGELLDVLPSTGFAVLAGDDPEVRRLAEKGPSRVLFVGEQAENTIQPTAVRVEPNRLSFRVDGQPYELPVTGRHHLRAALCAIAVGRELGLNDGSIAEGLADFAPVPGRSRPRQVGPWTVIDDTYNASPASVQAACAVLRDWPAENKKILVLGEMRELADYAEQLHREAGRQVAASDVDVLLAVGEHADALIRGAQDGGLTDEALLAFRDLQKLQQALDDRLEDGDVILVKGARAIQMERVVQHLQRRHQTDSLIIHSGQHVGV